MSFRGGGTAAVAYGYRPMLQNPTAVYTTPGWVPLAVAASNATSGSLYYIPIYIALAGTYTHISIGVNGTAAGKVARVGIYAASLDAAGVLRPGALREDGGTIALDTSGIKDVALTTTTFVSGWYFLALVDNDTTTTATYWAPQNGSAYSAPASVGLPNISAGGSPHGTITLVVTGQNAANPFTDPAPAPTIESTYLRTTVALKKAVLA